MYEKLEECPSCKHPKFSNYKICRDFSVSRESFALVLCDKCKLIFTNPRPDIHNIGNYYRSDNYISHTNKANNLVNIIYKQVRNITLRQKLNLLRSYSSGSHILDYGCGTGTFLNYCKIRGFDIAGYEPNETASQLAGQLTDTEIYSNQSQLKNAQNYDLITAWHVIEHVHDLSHTLKLLKNKLKPNGFMFIAVPNIDSYDSQFYDSHWAAYDVPRHLYHFNRHSFSYVATKVKLNVRAILPMKFDSYYVSLLSEKYKHGKTRFLSALKIGYKSNKQAENNGEYSSLIYVLTK